MPWYVYIVKAKKTKDGMIVPDIRFPEGAKAYLNYCRESNDYVVVIDKPVSAMKPVKVMDAAEPLEVKP